jgi:hypothetical protein
MGKSNKIKEFEIILICCTTVGTCRFRIIFRQLWGYKMSRVIRAKLIFVKHIPISEIFSSGYGKFCVNNVIDLQMFYLKHRFLIPLTGRITLNKG